MSAASRATKIDCPGELRPIPSRPLEMCLIVLAQVLDRRGIQPQAVPEFRDENSILVMDLNRGFQHRSPARWV